MPPWPMLSVMPARFLPLPQVLKDGGLLAPVITRLMNFFFFSRG